MSRTSSSAVSRPAKEVAESTPVRVLGRVGLTAYGVVHLLIAGLVVQIPFGDSERADKKGALQEVAATGPGLVLLWVVALGLAALVVWQLGEAVWGHRNVSGGTRALRVAINLAEAALFGVLAWSAGSIAAQGGSPKPSKSFASTVFEMPGGRYLVGLAGLGLVVGAGYAVYRGITRAFLRELDLSGAGTRRTRLVTRLGRVGWVALGVVYGLPGVLLVIAAVQYDAKTPTTLDAGLHAVAAEPYGPVLLFALAFGLAAFGVYCLFDARYRKA